MRNPHNYLADFQAELPLYERSDALVDFLLTYSRAIQSEASSSGFIGLTPYHVEALAVTMFEYGIVEEEDITLTQVKNDEMLSTWRGRVCIATRMGQVQKIVLQHLVTEKQRLLSLVLT